MTTTGKVKEQVTGVKTVSGLEPSAVHEIEGELRRLLADTFAERARKFGANTLRSVGDITRHRQLQDSDREHVEPEEMLKDLLSNNRQLVGFLRAAHGACKRHNDVATASLLGVWIDQAEPRAWFLAEIVGGIA